MNLLCRSLSTDEVSSGLPWRIRAQGQYRIKTTSASHNVYRFVLGYYCYLPRNRVEFLRDKKHQKQWNTSLIWHFKTLSDNMSYVSILLTSLSRQT